MDIGSKDILQQHILEEIQNREKILLDTYKNLKTTAIENKFFNSVLEDYDQYYKYIISDKKKQILAFQTISEYLDRIIMNTSTLNDKSEILKKDQENILKKLASIRKELQEITQ